MSLYWCGAYRVAFHRHSLPYIASNAPIRRSARFGTLRELLPSRPVEPRRDSDEVMPVLDDASATTDVTEYVGFPTFEHNQWTVEGEIERAGAFARGSHHVHGWRRGVAVVIALVFLLPVAFEVVSWALFMLGHLTGW